MTPPQLESGAPIEPKQTNITETKVEKEKEMVDQEKSENLRISPTPFPERLTLPRPMVSPNFDILGEYRNLCIKIPLLQAIQDIPIYAKKIKELCGKKEVKKAKVAPTIHVVGTLSDLLLGKKAPIKYEDPGNPIVTVKISVHSFLNTLFDLGVAINILTTGTCEKLGISTLEPTTTLLELTKKSVIRPK